MTYSGKQFIERAAPEFWYTYAKELADTADEIYKKLKDTWIAYSITNDDGENVTYRRPLVSRPVLLMHGLSFENLIKGLLISEEPTLLNGGKLSKHLLGHDLVKLAGRLRTVQLNSEQRNLLALLSDVVPYHGRYPVPRAAQDLKPEKYISEDIHQACKALFGRLELQLYQLNFEGIDAPEGVRFSNLRLTHRDGDADFLTDEQKLEHERRKTDFLHKFRGV
ncbi:MAG: hypothetical protein COW54_09600 [Rhodobacteraceae bacterium CG17_big_fil_post_rev_8_21_14_2_50_63_15]|nr:hypothetical protein [Roseovarius sp.]PIV78385.1 MAG: hypothetical protein COW54_09600 [Rhodobacteraceae bacterium CG17_big_fil_post_rev_8_21_14_2_50_63_15]